MDALACRRHGLDRGAERPAPGRIVADDELDERAPEGGPSRQHRESEREQCDRADSGTVGGVPATTLTAYVQRVALSGSKVVAAG